MDRLGCVAASRKVFSHGVKGGQGLQDGPAPTPESRGRYRVPLDALPGVNQPVQLFLHTTSRVLVSGGRLALNVWRSIEHQPGALAMAKALQRHVSAEAAAFRHTPFALGEAEAIEAPMREAGFRDVVIRPTGKTVRFPSADAFTMRYICGVAPLARMVSEVDDNARSALLKDVSGALQSYVDADGLAIPTASHLVTAHT